MTCTFCNIPYDDSIGVYRPKPIEALHAAIKTALDDPVQPAQHLLISGGTPKPKDIPWLREFYANTLNTFADVPVDIMMTPLPGLFDLRELATLHVSELSINLEIFNRDCARQVMRNKFNQGLDTYLDMIEAAAAELGLGRVRSMLMVGLEPVDDTLAGVRAIAERGGIPVLSPFRPDPVTPLRTLRPPTASTMAQVYLAAAEIADEFGIALGPECPACTHNTISFGNSHPRSPHVAHRRPAMVGSL
jgi:hypothetical protein